MADVENAPTKMNVYIAIPMARLIVPSPSNNAEVLRIHRHKDGRLAVNLLRPAISFGFVPGLHPRRSSAPRDMPASVHPPRSPRSDDGRLRSTPGCIGARQERASEHGLDRSLLTVATDGSQIAKWRRWHR
jgi:hypothetical protein